MECLTELLKESIINWQASHRTRNFEDQEEHSGMNENNVKQVLKERIIICVQILLMYVVGLFIGYSLGDVPSANTYRWRFYTSKGIAEILPLLILLRCRELITLLLDYFCMKTTEKELVIRLKETFMLGFLQKYRCEILSDKNTFLVIREFLYRWNIIRFIWLDKRITDMECIVGHTYKITMLRFSHLVIHIQEISDMKAIQEQLDEAKAGVYEANQDIELIQSQIHDCQRKHIIRQQKYEKAESQSQREVQLSCIEDIKKEIEALQLEMGEHIKEREQYKQQQKLLEEQIKKMNNKE